MIALLRYQAAILLRSHRWIVPLITYAVLLSAGAASGATASGTTGSGTTGSGTTGGPGTPLAQGLDWSAAALVPAVAFLTRSMLTAEPDAARACVAAAAGPVRSQLAALLTALGGGAVLAVIGACTELLTGGSGNAAFGHPGILLAGLATAVVCLLVASAAGALLNPPLLRHTGLSVLSTLAAVIFAMASDVSPAGAALRRSGSSQTAQWPGITTLLAAACLLGIVWTASALVAAKRDRRFPDAALGADEAAGMRGDREGGTISRRR